MNRFASGAVVLSVALLAASCLRKPESAMFKPTAFGAVIEESSGGKQFAQTGTWLPQPVVVQVNDEQGAGVAGALVEFYAAPGVIFDPANALTDSSGQADIRSRRLQSTSHTRRCNTRSRRSHWDTSRHWDGA